VSESTEIEIVCWLLLTHHHHNHHDDGERFVARSIDPGRLID